MSNRTFTASVYGLVGLTSLLATTTATPAAILLPAECAAVKLDRPMTNKELKACLGALLLMENFQGDGSLTVIADGSHTGPKGPAGDPGASGSAASEGAPGAQGAAGATGTTGATGAAGATGPAGQMGADGTPGATGATGQQGATGATGATGEVGP